MNEPPDSPEPQEPQAPSGPSRGRLPTMVIAAAVAAVILGGGAVAAVMALRGSDGALTEKIPADVAVYATVYLDPSASQKVNLFRMASRFAAAAPGANPVRGFEQSLDRTLEVLGLRREDVTPWLGSQIAFAVRLPARGNPEVAVLVDAKDEGAAVDALAKFRAGPVGRELTWRRVDYAGKELWVGGPGHAGQRAAAAVQPGAAVAVVDGAVVLGNDAEIVRAVIDASAGRRPSLEDSPDFAPTVAGLPKGKLAMVYVHVAGLMPQLRQGILWPDPVVSTPSLAQLRVYRGAALSVSARPEGLAFDTNVTTDPSQLSPAERAATVAGGPNEALAWVPDDAFALIAETQFKAQVEQAVQQAASDPQVGRELELIGLTGADGVVGHLSGDLALEVGPGSGRYPGGTMIVGTDDPPGMRAFLANLADEAARELRNVAGRGPRPRWRTMTHGGVDISFLRLPDSRKTGVVPAYAVTDEGFAIISTSTERLERAIDAHASGSSIATASSYRAAARLVPARSQQLLWVDLQLALAAVEQSLPPHERAALEGEIAALRPIAGVVSGSEATPRRQRGRLVILVP